MHEIVTRYQRATYVGKWVIPESIAGDRKMEATETTIAKMKQILTFPRVHQFRAVYAIEWAIVLRTVGSIVTTRMER